MKFTFFILSLIIISFCSCKENRKVGTTQTKVASKNNSTKIKKVSEKELTFEETQDSLRKLILNSKPNENLKSSILQELYIRGLVNEEHGKIKFDLPFNLHGFDCGAPDCYSTDLKFEIEA
ncbi:hypothetical protein EZJ43_13505 [Pedobacter changchengzhani]|uniref:Lipoprotein n=1 Tax=Pedobacter changchengzhani TaxID=2529274 RepID=A0A4R5MJ78_9SPHI|nr:hypothetical protein [Pedobacter changchengzhani]TDG35630.1 hypothetical protein EZJ43_13505 [Pedobacter changchengzhani]